MRMVLLLLALLAATGLSALTVEEYYQVLIKNYPSLFNDGKPVQEIVWTSTNARPLACIFKLDPWEAFNLADKYRTPLQQKHYKNSPEYPKMQAALFKFYLTIRKIWWTVLVNVEGKCVYDLKLKKLNIDINHIDGSPYETQSFNGRELQRLRADLTPGYAGDYGSQMPGVLFIPFPFTSDNTLVKKTRLQYSCPEQTALVLENTTIAQLRFQLVQPEIAVNGMVSLFTNTIDAISSAATNALIALTPAATFEPEGTLRDNIEIIWKVIYTNTNPISPLVLEQIPLNMTTTGYLYGNSTRTEQIYKDGIPEGKYIKYDNQNNILESGNKLRGLRQGTIAFRSPAQNTEGWITGTLQYSNGKKHGPITVKMLTDMTMTGVFQNDKPVGYFNIRNKSGLLVYQLLFSNIGTPVDFLTYKGGRFSSREALSQYAANLLMYFLPD